MERYGTAAGLHRRRSWHSGQDLGPPDPLDVHLLATFAGALGCLTSIRPVRLLSISSVGCTGPHHGSSTPAHSNSTLSLFLAAHTMPSSGHRWSLSSRLGPSGGSGRGTLALFCRRC
ncbi:uncharacterized protein BJ212DRAFT_1406484 [Suillus subaureus]|uniref:Uncharacterized protein n=1 Tax=Suillus subaureus TaxID=48587 RepID=A0A9P7IXN1_9AGAM|nr:uncharacterized protein BJ212DRAFT_1406484 [Suillus subaureus]KAG1797207.1 hypothetical protein BJ212DRAFT_1406484 [Suillus subaureus]